VLELFLDELFLDELVLADLFLDELFLEGVGPVPALALTRPHDRLRGRGGQMGSNL
jgi:hypothetical protein